MLEIRSAQNPRVKELRSLFTRRGRRRLSRAVLVGEKVVADAAAENADALDALFVREGRQLPAELIEAFDRRKRWILSARLFDEVARLEYDSPPALMATAAIPQRSLAEALAPPARGVVVACGLQDPGNLGTVMRSAWFLGLDGLICAANTADPWSPKALRAAIAAPLRRPPAIVAQDPASLIEDLKQEGWTPIVLAPRGGEPLSAFRFPPRSALLLGEEGRGLPEDVLTSGARRLTIEGRGAESLNVAAAFAIAAYAWSRGAPDQPSSP